MKIKFCFIGMISCLLLYLFACFLKKHHNVWFDQWRRVLKIKWEDPIEQKIPITRSEERRVGTEGRVMCRSRWSPDH